MRMRQNHRRSLPAVACTHALRVGCPHASSQHGGNTPIPGRSRWLRSTCALACRCNERVGEWLVLLGIAGIVGFCGAVLGFRAGLFSEVQYLAGAAGSLSVLVASVLIAHLGDPYEWQRSECQRASGSREPAEVLSISVSTAVTGAVAHSISRARTTATPN